MRSKCYPTRGGTNHIEEGATTLRKDQPQRGGGHHTEEGATTLNEEQPRSGRNHYSSEGAPISKKKELPQQERKGLIKHGGRSAIHSEAATSTLDIVVLRQKEKGEWLATMKTTFTEKEHIQLCFDDVDEPLRLSRDPPDPMFLAVPYFELPDAQNQD